MGCASSKQASEYSKPSQYGRGATQLRECSSQCCGGVLPSATRPLHMRHVADASNLQAKQAVLPGRVSEINGLQSGSFQQQAVASVAGGCSEAAAPACFPQLTPKQPAGDSAAASESIAKASAAHNLADDGGACPGLTSALEHIFNVASVAILQLGQDSGGQSDRNNVASAAAGLALSLTPWQYMQGRHEVLVIRDLATDARTRDSPYVNGRQGTLRFYAGMRLLSTDGQHLGTLCVCDIQPRDFSEAACTLLINCAGIVTRELEAAVVIQPKAAITPSSSRPSPLPCSGSAPGSASAAAAEAARQLGTGGPAAHNPAPATAGPVRGSVQRLSNGASSRSTAHVAGAWGGRRSGESTPARRSLDSIGSAGSQAMYSSLLSNTGSAAAAAGVAHAGSTASRADQHNGIPAWQRAGGLSRRNSDALASPRRSFDSVTSVSSHAMYSSLLSDIEATAAADSNGTAEGPEDQPADDRTRRSFDSVASVGSHGMYSSLLSDIEEVAAPPPGDAADAPATPQTPPQQTSVQRSCTPGMQPSDTDSSPNSSAASSYRPSFAAGCTASQVMYSSPFSKTEAAAPAASSTTAEGPTTPMQQDQESQSVVAVAAAYAGLQPKPSGSSLQQGRPQPPRSAFAAAAVQCSAPEEDSPTEDGQPASAPPSPTPGQKLPGFATAGAPLHGQRRSCPTAAGPPAGTRRSSSPAASSRRRSTEQALAARHAPAMFRAASLPQPEPAAASAMRGSSSAGNLKAAPGRSIRRRSRLATATGPGQPPPSLGCRTPALSVGSQPSAPPSVRSQASPAPSQPLTPCSQPSFELELDLTDELAAEFCLQPQGSSGSAAALSSDATTNASCFPEGGSSIGTALLDATARGWRLLYVDSGFAAATGVPHGAGGGGTGKEATFWQHFELLGAEGALADQPWWNYGARVSRGAEFSLRVTPKTRALASATMHISLRSAIIPEGEADAADAAATADRSTALADTALAGLYLATLQVPNKQELVSSLDAQSVPAGHEDLASGDGCGELSGDAGHQIKCHSIGNGEVDRLLHGCDPEFGTLGGGETGSVSQRSIGSGEVCRIACGGDAGSRRGSLDRGSSSGQTPFPDVRLGNLLGKGSFGSVYRGWRGEQEVAAKVIMHTGKSGAANAKELEATLGLGLSHDNIVRTYDYATISKGAATIFKKQSSRFADGRLSVRSDSGGAAAEEAQRGFSYLETWILLELCDAGSLQDAIDSGMLRGAPADAAACGEPQASDAAGSTTAPSASGGFDGASRPQPAVSAGAVACSDAAGANADSAACSDSAVHGGAAGSSDGARSGSAAGTEAMAPVNMQLPLACAVEVASAMAYLHARGITHNDLTCTNVLLSTDPADPRGFKCKVADLGLSRSMMLEASLETHIFGTVTHMPPELLSEGKLSKAADVYSFGVMLWEMYTGQRPWAGMRPVQVMLDKGQGGTALEWPDSTPESYRRLAQECLAHAPTSRPTFAEAEARCRAMAAAAAAGQLSGSR